MKEFEELKKQKKFSLLLADCIIDDGIKSNTLVRLTLDDCELYASKSKIKNLYAVKIQGGWSGNVPYPELIGCEYFILITAWARAAQVIDDNDMWLKRVHNQCEILESIASTGKPFLFIERAGVLGRYIDLEYRRYLDEKYSLDPKELGVQDAILKKENWQPQSKAAQEKRLKSYRDLIYKSTSLDNFFYYDLQDIMSEYQITKYCGENHHHGGVINSAPWHFREPWAECMYSVINDFTLTEQKPKLKQALDYYLL